MIYKKLISFFVIISLVCSMTSVVLADPTTDFHTGELPEQAYAGRAPGPKVE